MATDKEVEVLIRKVLRLSKSVKALSAEVRGLTEVLQKQNDWLADLAGILNGEDEEFEKEREEWKEHVNPVNRRRHHGSHKP